jgi:hypothetical protein
MYFG